ncbi:MAG TPA: hypothetical protein VMI34_20985 [Candidatus Bathyarchaeia archaeon]|nr:hypothetical protein [Candidatus Bathyarchaeia archaeon]
MDTPLLEAPVPGLAPRWQLSAPESYVLLHGPRADSVEAFKKGLLELIARGVLAIRIYTLSHTFRFPTRETLLLSGHNDLTALPAAPPLRSIYDLYRHAVACSRWRVPHVGDLGRSARALETPLKTYARRVVIPSLLERGLWRSEEHRVLGLFPRTTYVETPSGAAARAELDHLMGMAERDLADAVARDPKQALLLVGTLGAAVLLMDPLFPVLALLGQQLGPITPGSLELRVSGDFNFDASDLDAGSFGSLAGAFDTLSDSLDGGDGGGSDGGDGGGGGWGDGGGGD